MWRRGKKKHHKNTHKGENHQHLVMELWHSIYFTVTVRYDILSWFWGSLQMDFQVRVACCAVQHGHHGANPFVDTVVLVWLLKKLPAYGQKGVEGSDISSSPLCRIQFLKALFLLPRGWKPLPALGGWKKKGQGADLQLYGMNSNRWRSRRQINCSFPFCISLWI